MSEQDESGTTPDIDPGTEVFPGVDLPPQDPEVARHVVHVSEPSWFRRGLLWTAGTAIVLVAAGWLFTQLFGFLIILMLSLFVAFAMEPLVNSMAKRGVPRSLGTLGVMLGLAVATVVFLIVIGQLVVEQVTSIADSLPEYVENITRWFQDHLGIDLSEQTSQLQNFGLSNAGGLAGNAFGILSSLLGIVFQLFTVALFSYYFCAHGPRFRRSVCSMLPQRQQREILRVWTLAIDKTAGYLYSRALLGLASAIFHGAMLYILDVPYALTLALWVGLVSQFIPTVGTYLAGALPVLVAFTVSPRTAIIVLIGVILYQQFENYILTPPLSARTMELNPAVAFGSVIVGTTIFGIPGAFLALPLTATATAFVSTYVKRHDLVEDESLNEPTAGKAVESG